MSDQFATGRHSDAAEEAAWMNQADDEFRKQEAARQAAEAEAARQAAAEEAARQAAAEEAARQAAQAEAEHQHRQRRNARAAAAATGMCLYGLVAAAFFMDVAAQTMAIAATCLLALSLLVSSKRGQGTVMKNYGKDLAVITVISTPLLALLVGLALGLRWTHALIPAGLAVMAVAWLFRNRMKAGRSAARSLLYAAGLTGTLAAWVAFGWIAPAAIFALVALGLIVRRITRETPDFYEITGDNPERILSDEDLPWALARWGGMHGVKAGERHHILAVFGNSLIGKGFIGGYLAFAVGLAILAWYMVANQSWNAWATYVTAAVVAFAGWVVAMLWMWYFTFIGKSLKGPFYGPATPFYSRIKDVTTRQISETDFDRPVWGRLFGYVHYKPNTDSSDDKHLQKVFKFIRVPSRAFEQFKR